METRLLPQKAIGFVVALLPFALFGLTYSLLGLYPNWRLRPIDTEGVYQTELWLFGLTDGGAKVIPSAYCLAHTSALKDILAGAFYLCWIPVPMAFALYLWLSGRTQWCVRFGWAFLMTNFVGFAVYYAFPASPPWYVLEHGFQAVPETAGNAAGLLRFDAAVGTTFYRDFYARCSNVFAAMPSLHAAYVLVATVYARRSRCPRWMVFALAVITVGIWWTAVYTAHHYVLDVLAGIATALVGIALWEALVARTRWARRLVSTFTILL